MAHFMVRHAAPLCRAQHSALLLKPSHDPLDRRTEVIESYVPTVATGSDNRSLVHEVGDVGAGKPRGKPRNCIEIDVRCELHLANVPGFSGSGLTRLAELSRREAAQDFDDLLI
jgi:hypothetical protein